MNSRFVRKLLIDFSPFFTILLSAIAVWGYFASKDIELKLSLTDLLPQDHPAVVRFQKLTDVVGGVGYVEVLLEAEDGKSHLAIAPKVVEAVKRSPLVRNAFFEREERYFLDRALYYLTIPRLLDLEQKLDSGIKAAKRRLFDIGLWDDEAKTPEKKNELDPELKKFGERTAKLSPYLLSKDGKNLLVMVKPTFDSLDMGRSKQIVAFVDEAVKKTLPSNVKYRLSGRYFGKVKDAEIIEHDIYILGLLSNAIMAVILLLYFRSVRAVISIFVPVLLGLGITAVVARYAIGHVNLITGFLVGMIAGVGSDYGIHLLWRIKLESREPSSAEPDLLWRTLLTSGWANFVTLVATSLCLFLMCGSSFKVFSEFGFIAGVGLAAILLSKMLTFYCTSRWLKLPQIMAVERKYPFQGKRLPELRSTKSYYIGIAVTAVLALMASRAGFEFDFDKILEHSEEVREVDARIRAIYDRSTTPSAFAVPAKEEAVAIEKLLKEKYMPDVVGSIVSGATLVPDDQAKKAEILARVQKKVSGLTDRLLSEGTGIPAAAVRAWVAAKPFDWTTMPPYLREALRGTETSQYLLYVYPSKHLDNGPAVERFAGMVKDIESRYPAALTGSDAAIFSDILKLIERDGIILLLLIIVCLGIFLQICLRDWKHTLLSYGSFLISVPAGIGLMAIFDVKFNIFNVALLPVFLAAGVEVPVHLMQRSGEVRSGFKGVRDIAVSLQLSLLTTIVGFGILVFTRAGILKTVGWMSIFILLAGWWVGVFLHPAILERYFRWEDRRAERAKAKLSRLSQSEARD